MSAAPPTLPIRVRSYVVIPARIGSSRLPRKLLLADTGKPLIQHTYEAASRAQRPSGFCVAVDDEELAEAVHAFGGLAIMTSRSAASGTDRVAEVARRLKDIDIVVNVQGDEPDISPTAIDQVIAMLEHHPDAVMATLATPIRCRSKLEDPACVKVVFDQQGRALYFSRAAIPHVRDWRDEVLSADPPQFFQHIGLYAYRRDFLLRLASMDRSEHEQLENLEQLRVLSAGETILVGVTHEPAIGVDTPSDYAAFVRRMAT